MRNLWLCFNGTSQDEKRLNLPHLDYPLVFNIPRISWSDSKDNINLNSKWNAIEIHVDVLVEVKTSIRNRTANDADVLGYRICVGISDLSLIDNVSNPTIRDIVTSKYYSRFHEEANIVSNLIEIDSNIFSDYPLKILYDGNIDSVPLHFNFKALEIINFLCKFISLEKGDMVSLGGAWSTNCIASKRTYSVEFANDLFRCVIE
jgi:2-keto-4-pentenoate hydratase/2-oxohepta-3-ene-1,7-dioic acid hydratase in catechol pathway